MRQFISALLTLMLSSAVASAQPDTVANSAETAACTPPSRGPSTCKLLDVVIVSIGEPRPVGSEVSLMMRTISPVLTGGSVTLSRYGSVYLVRLMRADGTWRVRCLTNVPTDSPGSGGAAARCPPP